VLALNAAIQAHQRAKRDMDSQCRRGVQRLAERSAEATKQISYWLRRFKTIHTMPFGVEKSPLGVVEGAKLSEDAGQSLKEIEQVSTNSRAY